MRIVLAQRSVCAALFYFGAASAGVTPTLAYTVIAQHPHDSAAFTEGLAIDNGHRVNLAKASLLLANGFFS
jgi:glutamine cyclotransferase